MNWFRNAYHHQANAVKKHYDQMTQEQIINTVPIFGTYILEIHLYYKNPTCDGSNVFALTEKFVLDSLQAAGIVTQDNVKYHLGTHTYVKGQDKDNPRVEIFIKEYNNE